MTGNRTRGLERKRLPPIRAGLFSQGFLFQRVFAHTNVCDSISREHCVAALKKVFYRR